MNIPEAIKDIFAELEQTQLGGRRISRLVIDVRSGQLEMEFCGNEDDGQDVRRLEYHERNEIKKIDEWTAEFIKWERKHHGRIGEQDYRERVVKELQLLFDSTFLVPDGDLLNSNKLQVAMGMLEKWQIGCEHAEKLALLCDLVEYRDGYFCFEDNDAIEDYLEENQHQLSAKAINALLRFKTMMELCWQRTHKKEDFASLPDSRKDILCEILQLVENGEWIAPATTQNIQDMFRNMLGTIGGKLTSDDAELSDKLWNLLELGKGDRVKVTFQNLIGYFISQRLLKEGSPAQNKKFFGDTEGYSNIDKGINRSEMSKGFLEILPLLDKFCPKQT